MWGDAVGLVLLSPFTFLTTVEISQGLASRWASVLLGVLFTAPLLWRRTAPEAATGVVVLAHLVQLLYLDTLIPANLTAPVMLYTVARYGRAQLARVWLATALLGSLLAGLDWALNERLYLSDSYTGTAARVAMWFISCGGTSLAAWFLGQWLRQRQATLDSLRERAEALERERQQGMRLVAEEERSRIAREMHDIVAHSLSVIVVQSDGAGYLAGHDELGDPQARLAQVRQAIEAWISSGEARPALMLSWIRDVPSLGAVARGLQRDSLESFIDMVGALGATDEFRAAGVGPVSRPRIIMLLGGLRELTAITVEEGGRMSDVAEEAVDASIALLNPH